METALQTHPSRVEMRVLTLVASGCTNEHIGRQLHLSALTIKSHLHRLSLRYGRINRAGLVSLAYRSRWLDRCGQPD